MNDDEISLKPASMWEPTTNELDIAVLSKLGEELCEAGAAIFRVLSQGINGAEPTTGKINKQWVEDELADIDASASKAAEHFGLNVHRMNKRAEAKYNFKEPWFDWLKRRENSK